MSFYSSRVADPSRCPGMIQGDGAAGLRERACIQVKKVYDSCLQQEQLDGVIVPLHDIRPGGEIDPPLRFISSRSTDTAGRIRELSVDRLEDRPQFARVRCFVDIPMEVLFADEDGRQFSGTSFITVPKDVILYVPNESIIPFTVNCIVSAICVSGEYAGDRRFALNVCITVILKIVAEVEMLVPTYGFCSIPPCETFAQNVCDEFFSLPIFPEAPGGVI